MLDDAVVVDPTFAATRGEALYSCWRQEAPFRCYERAQFEEERHDSTKNASTREGLEGLSTD